MIHEALTDQDRERASLYALDALADDDARAFERHLDDGCAVCRAEVAALRDVASDLGQSVPPIAPPPGLRARVLDRAAAEPAGGMFVLRAGDRPWVELSPGVHRRDLSPGAGDIFLLRIAPGARVRTHGHATPEHCYVVEGDVQAAGQRLVAGDHHVAGPGSIHDGLWSEGGCTLLIANIPG